jgi:hypothetical protein
MIPGLPPEPAPGTPGGPGYIPPGLPGSPEFIPPGMPGSPGFIAPGMPGSPEYQLRRRRMNRMDAGDTGRGKLFKVGIVVFAIVFVAVLGWIIFVAINVFGVVATG